LNNVEIKGNKNDLHNFEMPERFREDAHGLFDGSGGCVQRRRTAPCDATQASDGRAVSACHQSSALASNWADSKCGGLIAKKFKDNFAATRFYRFYVVFD
jgi:hypothetical protein